MNERILELAEWAGLEFNDDLALKPEPIYITQKKLEKFARLIIRDVVDQSEKCFAGSAASLEKEELWGESLATFDAWNGAIKLSRNKIKQHFGVDGLSKL